MTTITRTTVAALIATLALAGCATPKEPTGKTTPSPTVCPSGQVLVGEEGTCRFEEAVNDASDAEPSEKAGPETPAKVGTGGFTYEDDLKVYVPSVRQHTPGEYDDRPGRGKVMIVVKVRIVNGTKKAVDADGTTVSVRSGDSGDEAEETYADGVDGFSGKIAPGRKATARYVFNVPKKDADQLDIDVSPGWDYESALFTGGV